MNREKKLEYALLLMVAQYGKLYNSFMCDGEEAFAVLTLKNGDDIQTVHKRIDSIEKEVTTNSKT